MIILQKKCTGLVSWYYIRPAGTPTDLEGLLAPCSTVTKMGTRVTLSLRKRNIYNQIVNNMPSVLEIRKSHFTKATKNVHREVKGRSPLFKAWSFIQLCFFATMLDMVLPHMSLFNIYCPSPALRPTPLSSLLLHMHLIQSGRKNNSQSNRKTSSNKLISKSKLPLLPKELFFTTERWWRNHHFLLFLCS